MKVAIALIRDAQKRILITQRSFSSPQGGLWEFPGGKLEVSETAESALIREIKEELGLEVLEHQFLGEIEYEYPDKKVQLLVFHVLKFNGNPSCLENQLNLKWVHREHLSWEDFPEANKGILSMLEY